MMEELTERTESLKVRDNWDKADILLRFIGAVGTAVVLACIGLFGSHFLARRQEAENDLRLYTELMSKREESDTSLRREMFDSIIKNFLTPGEKEEPVDPEKTVLNLELLASNFHDSLDLAPLFKNEFAKLSKDGEANKQTIKRLKDVSLKVIAKQVATLSEAGGKLDGNIAFSDFAKQPYGVKVINNISMPVKFSELPGSPVVDKHITVEALSFDTERQEVRVRLIVKTDSGGDEADQLFTVGFFDFPMLDNIRLPNGHRCAIVLNEFDADPENGSASLTFVYFPGSRASLKEKTYYDEILSTLRKSL